MADQVKTGPGMSRPLDQQMYFLNISAVTRHTK